MLYPVLMTPIGQVAELWRYPVKSMRGERLQEAVLEASGIAGDRRYAVRSTAAPAGKPLLSAAERTTTLRYTPRLSPGAAVRTPRGETWPLPSPELLRALQAEAAAAGARVELLASPERPLTDVRPVSLMSAVTLDALSRELGRAVDSQRFRSNLILALHDGRSQGGGAFAEDRFSGHALRFGAAGDGPTLQVLERIPRCRMVSLDPETTETDPEILRHLARWHEGRVGVYARVLRPGVVRVGDPVFRADPE